MKNTPEKIQVGSLTPDQKRELLWALEQMKELLPTKFMGLNVAQYRAFEKAYTLDKERNNVYPSIVDIEFANGVGKTTMSVFDMVGVTCGKTFLNWEVYPKEAIAYYDSLSYLRDRGKLVLRVTCDADDMKEGGSVHSLLKEFFPWAHFAEKDGQGCFKQIVVPHPTVQGISNSIVVKTFDQKESKHSGSTCQKIWINENLPDALWGETIGRIRSKDGMPDGQIFSTATHLDYAGALESLDDAEDVFAVKCRGHLYENCIGEEITEAMAEEMFREMKYQLQKNPHGPGYLTGGVLKRSKIESMIASWRRMCPHQLEARKTGAPISVTGKIYVTYNRDVHRVPSENWLKIPKNYPVIQIVDPHPQKPDISAWAAITPGDRLVFFYEWPSVSQFGFYDKIDHRIHTTLQTSEIWKSVEESLGIKGQIVMRLGDPNAFKSPNPDTMQTLQFTYAQIGFRFNLNVIDDLELGHRKVSEYLYFDEAMRKTDPNDPLAMPRVYFTANCENLNRGMQKYSRKQSRSREASVNVTLDETFKHPCDLVRYAVMWHTNHSFQSIRPDRVLPSDYDKIRNGRTPKSRRNIAASGRRKHGTREILVGSYS